MNNKRNSIFIVGAFRFPNGDAAAARVLGLGMSLKHSGYEVIFGGWEASGRSQDLKNNTNYSYEGFNYYSQNEFRIGNLPPLRRIIRYIFAGNNTLKWLKSIPPTEIKSIIIYQAGSLFMLRLAYYCWKNGIKLIADCTEWYDHKNLVGGKFGLVHLDSELRMRCVNRFIKNLIVISYYLENYYISRSCSVIRIPPTINVSSNKWPSNSIKSDGNRYLNLVYAGIPGKKDLLSPVLHGINELKNEGVFIVLNLIGPSKADLLNCVNNDNKLLDSLSNNLIFHGRVDHESVPRLIAESDFSILLRPDQRSSSAGFSTKLVESLASGVPIIANQTGDIDKYVKDGEEGILLPDASVKAFINAVKRILAMTNKELDRMRQAAKNRALNSFNFDNYSKELEHFIEL